VTTEEKLAWAINELADANCVDLDSPEEQAAWLDEYIIERTGDRRVRRTRFPVTVGIYVYPDNRSRSPALVGLPIRL
jgi:hypothetical protein